MMKILFINLLKKTLELMLFMLEYLQINKKMILIIKKPFYAYRTSLLNSSNSLIQKHFACAQF